MLNWADVTVRQEQHQDRLRQAKQRDLIRQMEKNPQGQRRLSFGHLLTLLLTWLGG